MEQTTLYLKRRWINRLMLSLSSFAAAGVILVLVLILSYTLFQGITFINPDFLTQTAKPVGETGGGMRNEIIGTLILISLASIIAIPVGLMSGIFLSEFGTPRIVSTVRFGADILAGVPSIVTGVITYAFIVRPLHHYSALAGGIALAIIMIPVVARTAEEALKMVPNSMREATLALGITRWRSILGVIVPGALTGIITGIMLGISRIAGETAPLIFTAFGNYFGFDGLDEPIGALPLQIWRYAMSPHADWHQQAWAGAFFLVSLILMISILVRWIALRRSGK